MPAPIDDIPFGNQVLIEAGIDKLDNNQRLELATQLIASVVVRDTSASYRDIMEDVSDRVDYTANFDGTIFGCLL